MARQGHGKILSYYDWGATPFFALQSEKRVSYCLFVPEDYDEDASDTYNLIVLVHGTERGATTYRDLFAGFARDHRCIILAPLFPVGLAGPGDLDSYKLIKFDDYRFDRLLLDMVEEVAAKYRLKDDRFYLHGFSGGGHFAHRFFYLHADRLRAVSIGAPGVVTLLDSSRDWWVGLRNIKEIFGQELDFDQMRNVAVQMVVGDEDKQTWEITIPESSSWWMPGANDAGETRIERLTSLRKSFEKHGIDVRFDLVAGVDHNGWNVLDDVKTFFAEHITATA